ncbi:hypothetical protein JCM3774_001756 [Rhodotorula dairenensis]
MFFVPVKGAPAPDFTAASLVLPQPSLASVAQLACDLIVHNYRLDLVGYLGLHDHVSAVGARDSLPVPMPGRSGSPEQQQPPGVALACEVFATPNRSLVIALPRSPVIRARRAHYLDSLQHWIRTSRFREVLVVAGADAAMRGDDGLNAVTPLRHLEFPSTTTISASRSTPPDSADSTQEASRLSTMLRAISPSYLSSAPSGFQSLSEAASAAERRIPPIPHGGLTRQILTTLTTTTIPTPSSLPSSKSEADSTPTTAAAAVHALIMYTSEGAGASESAHFLADALAYLFEPLLADLEDRVDRGPSAATAASEDEGGASSAAAAAAAAAAGQSSHDDGGKGRIRWKEPQSWERGLLGPELAREAGREMYG